MNSTELSKYIWQLGDRNKDFNIKWTIVCRARPYSNITKRCNLCTTEKLMIINSKPDELRNISTYLKVPPRKRGGEICH